ncbi:N-methyltransferase [Sporothrix brasiliensis 5110]|uniref:N-methyltransferase n=1 Tax=Sporothrix brasiliensis 5110 TaxID=1398154 RepID=A0A0C2J3U9_9PEZI|nr:N-methyltransferase [Sporothrix brasiliensis 5110]KIH91752.1 N-methyltransferase [Sporothrix brasiliensis 5110]
MSPSAELLEPHGGAASTTQKTAPAKTMATSTTADSKPAGASHNIIDIRQASVEMNLRDEIVSQFCAKNGPRTMPTLLLYDEAGLQLFEDITYLEEYYLTNNEINVLTAAAAEIAELIPQDSMIIELGSGNLRKINLLLQALETSGKRVEYYALDLSLQELQRTLSQLPRYEYVRCFGLLGTYDDGREWLKTPAILHRQKYIVTLGSSIGNFHRDDAADFLRGFSDVLHPGDSILVGLDGCVDADKVYHAYNDKEGLTHRFVLNGLINANRILGKDVFQLDDWRVIGEYVHDIDGGRHQAFYAPVRDVEVLGERIQPHERVQVEQSVKYSPAEANYLWRSAGLTETYKWQNDSKEHDKPIKLRNACIFYLGHIPTFLDIQLCKTTGEAATEPAYYARIFERGIDPDVDNPELCHDHSEIPDEWPALNEILGYQKRVRERIRAFYATNVGSTPQTESHAPVTRPVAQAIWVGFEHELMHLETLLYMMLQSDKTLPPPNVPKPDFAKLAAKARAARVENQWFDIPAQDLVIGIDDPDNGTDLTRNFGWDNEKPARAVHVHAFQAQGRPITNEEYALYMYNNSVDKNPVSWSDVTERTEGHANGLSNGVSHGHANGHTTNGHANGDSKTLPSSFLKGKMVRTVYGLVPLEYALDWPVFASYDELKGCASWMGGRIPTFEEARSIYQHVDLSRQKQSADKKLGKTLPAVNGHLSNDGVEETPPAAADVAGSSAGQGDNLFVDLDGANVGFQHWHPVAVTAHGNRLAGQAEMGGVWEWTSSPLRRHDGFEPMRLYPGYTADFFDEKHNIVLGGSWATHPRISGRKSFVNWYQRNYQYAWVGARLVRDI